MDRWEVIRDSKASFPNFPVSPRFTPHLVPGSRVRRRRRSDRGEGWDGGRKLASIVAPCSRERRPRLKHQATAMTIFTEVGLSPRLPSRTRDAPPSPARSRGSRQCRSAVSGTLRTRFIVPGTQRCGTRRTSWSAGSKGCEEIVPFTRRLFYALLYSTRPAGREDYKNGRISCHSRKATKSRSGH